MEIFGRGCFSIFRSLGCGGSQSNLRRHVVPTWKRRRPTQLIVHSSDMTMLCRVTQPCCAVQDLLPGKT